MTELRYNEKGLIPVITVDNTSGKVLMLAYMNAEALKKTLDCGKMTYFSRSRNCLWLKGETSGHFQELVSLTADCDCDTLLARVNQTGAACHTGSESCFFNDIEDRGALNSAILFDEEKNILERKACPKEGSYTNYLLDCGVDKICKKIGEEASEVIIAAKNNSASELIGEVCDLIYHVEVLLAAKEIPLADVFTELKRRREKENNLKPRNVKGEL